MSKRKPVPKVKAAAKAKARTASQRKMDLAEKLLAQVRAASATAALANGQPPVEVPRGRPTKYDKAFCEPLLAHMAGGLSFESYGGVIGVCKKTLYNWTKENDDFLHAKELGTELGRLWMEKLGIQGVQGLGPRVLAEEVEEPVVFMGVPLMRDGKPVTTCKRKFQAAQFNAGTWTRFMLNRWPEEWRDRQEITGKDGKDLLPPQVPWSTMVDDPNVQAFLAERARVKAAEPPPEAQDARKPAPHAGAKARKPGPKLEPVGRL